MKAFFIPVILLTLLLLVSVFSSICIQRNTSRWIDILEDISELADEEKWTEALHRLTDTKERWICQTAGYHIIMEHQALDEAKKLFSGALAACQEQDSTELHIHLDQLATHLEFLAETQKISWKNIM